MKNDFEKMKDLNVIGIKRVKTYHISLIASLLFLLITLIVTFIYVIIPLKNIILNIGFTLGIAAGLYNIIGEIAVPERHLHFMFKLPADYDGWKGLFLISKCIQYDSENDILVLQFLDSLEKFAEQEIKKIVQNGEDN